MLDKTTRNFRRDFLLKFTQTILEHTQSFKETKIHQEVKDVIRMGEIKKAEVQPVKKEIKQIVSEKLLHDDNRVLELEKHNLSDELRKISNPIFTESHRPKKILPRLNIPEHRLPEPLQHIKPVPVGENVNIQSLNSLINDPMVKVIECTGAGEKLIVMGIMGRKQTAITLSKEEIVEVVKTFSMESKIPVHEGLFKAAVGNLVLSAVISDIVGIQFVIRKIA